MSHKHIRRVTPLALIAILLACQTEPVPADTIPVREALMAFQARTGEVVHYSPGDLEGVEVELARSERAADIDALNELLAPHGLALVHVGPADVGFWSVRPI